MLTIIAFLVVLGVLVFVHEFGHFIVAKMCGVGVYTFSIGYGKRMFGFTHKGTDYRVSMIPLGGYVKLVGQSDTLEPDERDQAADARAHFYKHPLWHRFLIVLAGPVMNLLFAFAVAPVIYWMGIEEERWRTDPPVVGYVLQDSEAWRSGLRAGARIETLAGKPVATWLDVIVDGQLAQGETIEVTASQGGKKLRWQQPVLKSDYLPDQFPFYYPMPARVGDVMAGGAAQKSGLRPGDLILTVDGQPVGQFPEIAPHIQARGGDPVRIEFERGGVTNVVSVEPTYNSEGGRWLIGIGRSDETRLERYGFVDGIRRGAEKAWTLIVFSVDIIGRLFTGNVGMRTLGGPIMIAQAAGSAASQGLEYLISLMLFISIQLGLMNLLPIPVLDGGHLMLFTIEAITRRPPSPKVVEWASRAGFAFLVALMVVATANDLMRVLGPYLAEWLK